MGDTAPRGREYDSLHVQHSGGILPRMAELRAFDTGYEVSEEQESLMRFSTKLPETAPARGHGINSACVVSLLAVIDLLWLSVFLYLSYRQAAVLDPAPARVWEVTDALFCSSLLYLMFVSGTYRITHLSNVAFQVSRILLNGFAIAVMEWIVLRWMGFDDEFAWPWNGPINLVSIAVLGMCATRVAAHRILLAAAHNGQVTRNIAIVGAGLPGLRLISALYQKREPWTKIIGVFDDRKNRLQRSSSRLHVNGTVEDLIEFARTNRVDEVLVALPWNAEGRLLDILERLKVIPANVRMAPDGITHHFMDNGFSAVDGIPVYNIYRKPISDWGALLKRIEDLVLGSLAMVVAAPAMFCCAVAIKLDSPGPVLFRQKRYGYNSRLINVYKFRTMYDDARDDNCDRQTTKDDPRITRVGHFLRRTSLDELPQLFNVLGGEMSLVGPRPHAVNTKAAGKLFEEIVHEYAARHKIKPGITGWAQVLGWRGETDTEEKIRRRVECDLYYMEHWSLFLDIEILFRTLWVLTGKNVY